MTASNWQGDIDVLGERRKCVKGKQMILWTETRIQHSNWKNTFSYHAKMTASNSRQVDMDFLGERRKGVKGKQIILWTELRT